MKKTSTSKKPDAKRGESSEADRAEAVLLDLIRSLRAGQMSCAAAAERETNEELKSLYGQCAEQKALYAPEIAEALRSVSKNPAAAVRAKAILEDKDDEAKAVSGDDAEANDDDAVELYRRALDIDMPAEARDVLERQYAEIQETRDHLAEIKSLEFNTDQDDRGDDRGLGRDIL